MLAKGSSHKGSSRIATVTLDGSFLPVEGPGVEVWLEMSMACYRSLCPNVTLLGLYIQSPTTV